MDRLFFYLILVLTAGGIFLLTGRNRRQIRRIPRGMVILCQPPGKRYVLYALGVVTFACVMLFLALYIMDGAPEDARLMWGLCVALAVLLLFLTILGGNMMARDCVYFDREGLRIEKAFRKPRTVLWSEIRRIEGDLDRAVRLYLADGTRVLTANNGMVHYELFCNVLKESCPGGAADYYQSRTLDKPEACVLRYGTEYFVLAVMGILILLVYLAMLLSADGGEFLQQALHSDPSQWLAVWFAPICGVVSVIALFIFCNTKIMYSPEQLVLKYPLRSRRELYWRDIRQVEVIPAGKREEEGRKKLWLHTAEGVYRIDLGFLTHGRDGFLTELSKRIERYGIPCTGAGRDLGRNRTQLPRR